MMSSWKLLLPADNLSFSGISSALFSHIYFSHRSSAYGYPYSSGDTTGAPPATQMANYDALVARRPTTTLSLEHEIVGKSTRRIFKKSPPPNSIFL